MSSVSRALLATHKPSVNFPGVPDLPLSELYALVWSTFDTKGFRRLCRNLEGVKVDAATDHLDDDELGAYLDDLEGKTGVR